jgi:thiol-disulfide isomerase/thioredoxin
MAGHVEIIHLTTNGKNIDNEDINKTHVKTNPNDLFTAFTEKKPIFIDFYANWCGHCKTIAPEWEKLIKSVKEDKSIQNLAIVAVESGVNDKHVANMLSKLHLTVKGYPTLGAILNNKFIEYDGGRTAADMLNYIKATVVGKQGGGHPQAPVDKRSRSKSRSRSRRTIRKVRWIRTTRPRRTHYNGRGSKRYALYRKTIKKIKK